SGALRTGRTQLGAGRIDFNSSAVLILLMGEPTARIWGEPRRRAAQIGARLSDLAFGDRAAVSARWSRLTAWPQQGTKSQSRSQSGKSYWGRNLRGMHSPCWHSVFAPTL